MRKTPRAIIDQSSAACAAIEGAADREDVARAASRLISWAAFHLGVSCTAVAIVDGLASPEGFADLRRVLRSDAHDTMEIQAFIVAASGVSTALDLCASAVLRLAGVEPAAEREWDFGQWRKRRAGLVNPQALLAWADAVDSSAEQQLLVAARHQAVHRTTRRGAKLSAGGQVYRYPTDFEVGGVLYPVDDLVRRFTAHGEEQFDRFCDAVAGSLSKPRT